MLHKTIILLVFGLLCSVSSDVGRDEQLIIFTNDAQPIMTGDEISSILDLASSMHLETHVIRASEGMPEEVATLPSIYYQNKNGRSRYYGRYKNIDRIKNFIRTSKLAHQQDQPNIKDQLLVWKSGRANIAAPIKVTPLEGDSSKGTDPQTLKKEILAGMAEGMKHFDLANEFAIQKDTRSFYFNIYPYLGEDGYLSLTTEIFSQFNCVKPIYKSVETPIVNGKWKKRNKLYREAGKLIETEILKQISASIRGDAFTAVPTGAKIKSWKELGLEIHTGATDDSAQNEEIKVELARSWRVSQERSLDDPIIIFSFLSPVDNYAGEVKALQGQLDLGEDMSMDGAQGKFSVDISDVTMGSKDFDYEVHNKMLKIGLFPDATFEFSVENLVDAAAMEVGRREEMKVKGTFQMMGISIPIEVNTQIEPIFQDKDILNLSVNCTFQLPLMEAFGVLGPDGPSPAKDRLQFYMRFNMEPII